jgi:hypothetical protein
MYGIVRSEFYSHICNIISSYRTRYYLYWRRACSNRYLFTFLSCFEPSKHENMCSVARLALDDAIGRATFAEHLTKITHELDRLLVSRKVTSVLVLADESHVVGGADPTVGPPQS